MLENWQLHMLYLDKGLHTDHFLYVSLNLRLKTYYQVSSPGISYKTSLYVYFSGLIVYRLY